MQLIPSMYFLLPLGKWGGGGLLSRETSINDQDPIFRDIILVNHIAEEALKSAGFQVQNSTHH